MGVALGSRGALAHAPASDPTILAVTPLTVKGELPAGHRKRLDDALAAALASTSTSAIAPSATNAADPDPSCRSPACLVALAGALQAEYVLTTEVIVEGRDFRVLTTVASARDGRVALSSAEDCEICGVQEVASMVTTEVGRVLARVDSLKRPASVRVDSRPSGATVLIDGVIVGTTPYEDDIAPGHHTVALRKPGHAQTSREIEAGSDVVEHIELELHPLRTDRLRVAGGVLVGAGAVLLVPGITFAALHHRPVKSKCGDAVMDVNGGCPYRYDTMPYGATLLAVGGAGLVAGIVLLAVAAKRGQSGQSTRARLQVSPFAIGVRL
jgi:hypothetical protein